MCIRDRAVIVTISSGLSATCELMRSITVGMPELDCCIVDKMCIRDRLYIVLSFLIPSSSGMATVSMPIMGPLANSLGFSPDVMIMIFSAGNGLVNLFTPTSGAIMGGLALAKVEYSTWLKFGGKLFIVLGVACIIILTAAMMLIPGAA